MEVHLPFIDGAFSLCLDKEVNDIPIDFNSDDLTANGVVKWLGKLPVSNSIKFAGLEMDNCFFKFNGSYAGISYFNCSENCGVFLPVELVVRYCDNDVPKSISNYYCMNARPHGIALIIEVGSTKGHSVCYIETTFKYLRYKVELHHNKSSLQMTKLVKEIVSLDHKIYDSFVCCILFSEQCQQIDIDGLVDNIQKCSSLQGKPKLLFIQSSQELFQHSLQNVDPDMLIVWTSLNAYGSDNQFANALWKAFRCNIRKLGLISVMEKVAAYFVSMFPPEEANGKMYIEMNNKLKKEVYFLSPNELPDYSLCLKPHDEEYITFQWTTLILSGPASNLSVLKLLLNNVIHPNESPDGAQSNDSPGSAHLEIGKIETTILQVDESNTWKKMDYESLKTVREKVMKDGSKLHFVNAIESRGHAAFLDIVSPLLHYNPVNVLALELNQKLKDDKTMFYNIEGKQIKDQLEERQLTHLEYLETSFRSLLSVSTPDLPVTCPSEEPKPSILVLGISNENIDCNESLDEKNRILWPKLEQFRNVNKCCRATRKEVIFSIDPKAKKYHEIATKIRRIICKSSIEVKISYLWFKLLLELYQLRSGQQSAKIIRKTECVRIGRDLKMDSGDIETALIYFHHLTFISYFPKVLPDIVFLHPQPIFDKLSELISISIADAVDHLEDEEIDLMPGAHIDLKEFGTFERDLLKDFPLFSDDFTAEDFLQLMEHFHIISYLPQQGKYFLPRALRTTLSEALTCRYKAYVDPLILTWNKKPIPQGLYIALVVNLLGRENSPKFDLVPESVQKCQYRNAIRLRCVDLGSSVLLVESNYWLEIYYFGFLDSCPLLSSAIIAEVTKVAEKFHIKKTEPEVCFYCTKHEELKHLCRVHDKSKRMTCCEHSEMYDMDRKYQLPWFEKVESETDKNLRDITAVLEKKPDKDDLLNILATISAEWQEIGMALKISNNDLSGLAKDATKSNIVRLSDVLEKWMETATGITWQTIIGAVDGPIVNKSNKATEICRFLAEPENYSKYNSMK